MKGKQQMNSSPINKHIKKVTPMKHQENVRQNEQEIDQKILHEIDQEKPHIKDRSHSTQRPLGMDCIPSR